MVKPTDKIGDIKIVQMDGVGGMLGGKNGVATLDAEGNPVPRGSRGGLVDQMVEGVMQYRVQAPFVDHLLKTVGIEEGATPNGVAAAVEKFLADKKIDLGNVSDAADDAGLTA